MSPGLRRAAILLSLLTASPAWAADARQCSLVETAGQKRDEGTVKRIEAAWLGAEYRGNVGYLDCLLDPGYKVIAARTGEIRSKADLLTSVAKNKGKTPTVPPLATIVVINGAFATAFSSMKGKKADGTPYEAQFVDSYVFRHGAWRAVGGVDF
jgi:hypothetical protein